MLCVCKMLLSTLQYILSLLHNLLLPCIYLFCSSAPGLPKHVEGIIIGASVLAVILVVAFILLTVAAGYYYYRKNKVVIVKVCVREEGPAHDMCEYMHMCVFCDPAITEYSILLFNVAYLVGLYTVHMCMK